MHVLARIPAGPHRPPTASFPAAEIHKTAQENAPRLHKPEQSPIIGPNTRRRIDVISNINRSRSPNLEIEASSYPQQPSPSGISPQVTDGVVSLAPAPPGRPYNCRHQRLSLCEGNGRCPPRLSPSRHIGIKSSGRALQTETTVVTSDLPFCSHNDSLPPSSR